MSLSQLIKECEDNKIKWYVNPMDHGIISVPYYYGTDYIMWLKKCSKYLRKNYAFDADAIRFNELANSHSQSCYEEELNEMLACLKMIDETDDNDNKNQNSFEKGINKNELFSFELLNGANSYYVKLLKSINSCYKYELYDACYVLIRKLISSLLIDIIEKNGHIEEIYDNDKVKDLKEIISVFLNKSYWKYSKGINDTLNNIRLYGNNSVHNKYFIANKNDIDRDYHNYRFLIEELCLNLH